jgi:TetR/AcrR family transcriptional regulator
MPKVIDHEERKKEILYAALEVFAQEGYKNTNLGLIASACGLSRTTVYQYFKDKSEIFSYAIKATTDAMLAKYSTEEWTAITDPEEKLTKIMMDILDTADSIEKQIKNLVKFLNEVDYDIHDVIKRRTAMLAFLLARVIRDIVKQGNPNKKVNAQDIAQQLIVLGESYCLQMVYLPQNRKVVRDIITDLISSLKK